MIIRTQISDLVDDGRGTKEKICGAVVLEKWQGIERFGCACGVGGIRG
jgi:hypothetical protein